jgi:hypothetical protein
MNSITSTALGNAVALKSLAFLKQKVKIQKINL